MKKRIIDKRKKEKFMVDDEYLNGQAKLCGIYATGVYMILCRHSNKEQYCFPSIKLMTEKLSISRNSVIKGIRKLEENKIIEIKKTRSKNGEWLNNSYILLDKSEWKNNQVNNVDMVNQVPHKDTAPSPSHDTTKSLSRHHQVPHRDTKETHMKETHRRKHMSLRKQVSQEIIPDLLNDKNEHIKIIGLYARLKNINFISLEQQQSFIKRNLRAASNLKPYPIERIIETMKYLKENADFKITLSSVGKFIDEDLNSLNKKDDDELLNKILDK